MDSATIAGNKATLITFDGKPVKLLDQVVKAEFSAWVMELAWKALYAMRPYVPDEEYRAERTALLRRQGLGHYSFMAPICQEAMTTDVGGFKLISLLIGCSEDELLILSKAGRGPEIRDILARVVALSVGGTAEDSPATAPNA